MIRTGRVSKVNYERGTFEVTYFDRGKSVTTEVNAISNGEYKMPKVGQVVSVMHSSNASVAAVSAGTIWNESNKPAEGKKGLFRKELADTTGKAYVRYDGETGEYRLHVNGKVVVEVGSTVVEITGNAVKVRANSIDVSAGGGDILIGEISHTNHTHTDNVPGETTKPH